ncbi:MAG: helix-turn-helix protein [Pelotomaculum sp. PtaU1.Bin065]|nr:MAG: helix-turn-helix protein [Pelotomaculum sp. PtaU1.Bin065]
MTVIELCRRAKGLSGVQLSGNLNLSRVVVSKIETGHETWPKLRRDISEMLGVDETVLFDETGRAKTIPETELLQLIMKAN